MLAFILNYPPFLSSQGLILENMRKFVLVRARPLPGAWVERWPPVTCFCLVDDDAIDACELDRELLCCASVNPFDAQSSRIRRKRKTNAKRHTLPGQRKLATPVAFGQSSLSGRGTRGEAGVHKVFGQRHSPQKEKTVGTRVGAPTDLLTSTSSGAVKPLEMAQGPAGQSLLALLRHLEPPLLEQLPPPARNP